MTDDATVLPGADQDKYSQAAPCDAPSAPQLLVLSAESEIELEQSTAELCKRLAEGTPKISDVAYTLQAESGELSHRRMLACTSPDDAVKTLTEKNPNRVLSSRVSDSRRPTVLMFPGVGDHYVGMGHGLYTGWQVFRDEVDRCACILRSHLDIDIREVLYPANQRWKNVALAKGIDLKRMLGRSADDPPDPETIRLNMTLFAQPALFTVEYATARLWQSLGVTPDGLIGHSMGEYVAACLAGVFSLEDALRLIAARAKLVNALPQATMLAVMLPEDELRPILPTGIDVSLNNGPNHCVVAGAPAEMRAFEETLCAREIISLRVQNGHAFHTSKMEPILRAFEAEIRAVPLREPRIPYLSNVTGDWVTSSQAMDPAYWVKHTSQTARFSDALGAMWRLQNPLLIECGPGKTLNVLAAQHPARQATLKSAIWSMRQRYENEHDEQALITGIGKVWLSGKTIQWDRISRPEMQRRVPALEPPEDVASNEPHTADEPGADNDEPRNQRERELVSIWKEALGQDHVGVNASFGALGGDSLSSVGAILQMRRLGVPDEIAKGLYQGLTIRQMAQMETSGGSIAQDTRIELASIETPLFARAFAIYLVVASHFGLTTLGGNWTLMIVSGLNFAKFQLRAVEREGNVRPIFRLMLKLAIPSFLLTAVDQLWNLVRHGVGFSPWTWLLLDNLRDPAPFKGNESPWFVDLLLQCWLILAILFSIRSVRQYAIRRAYEFGLIFLALSWVISVIIPLMFDPSRMWVAVPYMYLWLMAIGWCSAYGRTRRQRLLTSVALVGLSAIDLYFQVGQDMHAPITVPAGLAIIWFDELPAQLPRPVINAAIGAAGASLFIYMTHGYFDVVLRFIWKDRPPIIAVAWAMFGGFLIWKLWNYATRITLQWSRKAGLKSTDLRVSAVDG